MCIRDRFKSIQGRRYDYDGSAFYWQYRIAERMAIPIPFAPAGFDATGFKPMNSGCFEGMFIHRSIVKEIGLPDPRFFIYWDDQMYGWLASRKTQAVIVDEFVLRRTREINQGDMGIRHMNASSNAYRYYIMRNRAIIKRYYRALDVYNPLLFGPVSYTHLDVYKRQHSVRVAVTSFGPDWGSVTARNWVMLNSRIVTTKS